MPQTLATNDMLRLSKVLRELADKAEFGEIDHIAVAACDTRTVQLWIDWSKYAGVGPPCMLVDLLRRRVYAPLEKLIERNGGDTTNLTVYGRRGALDADSRRKK